jgi:flagellar biosynthesis/type III secretory pathway protein FliH
MRIDDAFQDYLSTLDLDAPDSEDTAELEAAFYAGYEEGYEEGYSFGEEVGESFNDNLEYMNTTYDLGDGQ